MLSVRDRLAAFPHLAAPALSAVLLGRLLAGAGPAMAEALRGRAHPLAAWTDRFLQLSMAGENHGAAFQTFGNWLAVAISVTGFLIVHRLGPERAYRVLVVHLSLSWAIQAVLLLATVAAIRE